MKKNLQSAIPVIEPTGMGRAANAVPTRSMSGLTDDTF